MIPGAREVGKVYHIHPLDVESWLSEGYQEYVLDNKIKNNTIPIRIGNDIYFQTVDQPAVTKDIFRCYSGIV